MIGRHAEQNIAIDKNHESNKKKGYSRINPLNACHEGKMQV
jgi:hypothetical protein